MLCADQYDVLNTSKALQKTEQLPSTFLRAAALNTLSYSYCCQDFPTPQVLLKNRRFLVAGTKQEHKDALSACAAVQQFCHVWRPTGQHASPVFFGKGRTGLFWRLLLILILYTKCKLYPQFKHHKGLQKLSSLVMWSLAADFLHN